MSENRKLVLLLLGAVALVAFSMWMISPLKEDNPFLGDLFGPGDGDEQAITSSGPPKTIDFSKDYYAVVNTSAGEFTIELHEDSAPYSVNNFVYLSNVGYYDNSSFHRIINNFIVQGGLSADGRSPDYALTDEINADSLGLSDILVKDAVWLQGIYDANDPTTQAFLPANLSENATKTVKQFYKDELGFSYRTDIESKKAEQWSVGLSNEGPDTASSQFFIITRTAQPHLDGRYTIFGEVTQGHAVVQEIESSGAGAVTIFDVDIVEN